MRFKVFRDSLSFCGSEDVEVLTVCLDPGVQMLWLGANTWLFLRTYLLYSTGQQYHYLYNMLGVRNTVFFMGPQPRLCHENMHTITHHLNPNLSQM